MSSQRYNTQDELWGGNDVKGPDSLEICLLACVLFCALENYTDMNIISILKIIYWKIDSFSCMTKWKKSKVLRTLKCAISIFDLISLLTSFCLSLTLNWEKAREDFEISLSIYQLSFPSYSFFVKVAPSMPLKVHWGKMLCYQNNSFAS